MVCFQNTEEWPAEWTSALGSGLPPRLCLAWAIVCVDHVLPIYAREFHQDTRPKRLVWAAWEVAMGRGDSDSAASRNGMVANAREVLAVFAKEWWNAESAGCRVARRTYFDRVLERATPGERVARAAYSLARMWKCGEEPGRLWQVFEPNTMADGYDSPASRCQ